MDYPHPTQPNSPEPNSATEFSPQLFMGDFAEATHELLLAASPSIRAQAARRLASLGMPLASAYLVAALSDTSWEVRQAAAESLAEIGEPESIKAPSRVARLRERRMRSCNSQSPRAIQSISARSGQSSATLQTRSALVEPDQKTPHLNRDSLPSTPVRQVDQNPDRRHAEFERLQDEREKQSRAITATQRLVEVEAQRRIEKERQLAAEIEALRGAEAEQQKRIQEASAEARGSESEAEAQARTAEKERRLAESDRCTSESRSAARRRPSRRRDD